MRPIDEDTITQAVIASHAQAGDRRLREVMTSLVQHLHTFAREVGLKPDEWQRGIDFLAEAARLGRDGRQELVLLSDTLGLSMLVAALNHRKPRGCTEATAQGPCYVAAAPHYENGADIAHGAPGEPCFVRGCVVGLDGAPVAGAEVEVWQADGDGRYDMAADAGAPPRTRGIFRSDAGGRFHFRSVVAAPYTIEVDGPVGRLLQALGRDVARPAHLNFVVSAPGYERLVTHVYRGDDPQLDADPLFGVRPTLVTDWLRHDGGPTPDGGHSALPYCTLNFTFVLQRTPQAAGAGHRRPPATAAATGHHGHHPGDPA